MCVVCVSSNRMDSVKCRKKLSFMSKCARLSLIEGGVEVMNWLARSIP